MKVHTDRYDGLDLPVEAVVVVVAPNPSGFAPNSPPL